MRAITSGYRETGPDYALTRAWQRASGLQPGAWRRDGNALVGATPEGEIRVSIVDRRWRIELPAVEVELHTVRLILGLRALADAVETLYRSGVRHGHLMPVWRLPC